MSPQEIYSIFTVEPGFEEECRLNTYTFYFSFLGKNYAARGEIYEPFMGLESSGVNSSPAWAAEQVVGRLN